MFKKVITLLLAVVICFAAFVTAFAETDEEFDFPCGGVIEMVQVKILYAPIKSLVVYGDSELELSGIVLKITYPTGEEEILIVEKNGNQYHAGDFSVSVYNFGNTESAESVKYGIFDKQIHLYFDKTHGGYTGDVNLFYLNIPTISDIYNLILNYSNII